MTLQWDDTLERIGVSYALYGTSRVHAAWECARETYAGTLHWSGERFDEHVLGVLKVFMRFCPDADAVQACILHHVLQFPHWNTQRLDLLFGKTIQSIVRQVHLLSHVTLRNRRVPVQNLRKMLVQASDDPRALLIILCDRCSMLQHIHLLSEGEQRRVCQDVLQLFAPAAARLGIYALKHELERLAFPVAYPTDAERIQGQIDVFWKEYSAFLQETAIHVQAFLREHGVHAVVKAREKQLYSMFAKMHRKGVSHITHIYDLFALRVVVNSVEECYRALGFLHTLGHPVPHRFKDYIAFPKPNGYRSVHTTLTCLPKVPPHVFTEVQIRTHDMHRQAELGIAAHWQYKEMGSVQRATHKAHLEELLADTRAAEVGSTDHIFVLTPTGDVIELLEGSMPLDFAFAIHSDLGFCFRSVRVNGAIVPMDHILDNGDVVEIMRWKSPRPSVKWLSLVRTAGARLRLRKFFAAQEDIAAQEYSSELKEEQPRGVVRRVKKHPLTVQPRQKIICDGIAMPTSFAKCCRPDERGKDVSLVGVIGRSGIVKVHWDECGFLKRTNPERHVVVMWRTE